MKTKTDWAVISREIRLREMLFQGQKPLPPSLADRLAKDAVEAIDVQVTTRTRTVVGGKYIFNS